MATLIDQSMDDDRREVMKWIESRVSKPPPEDLVLVRYQGGFFLACWMPQRGYWFNAGTDEEAHERDVTHWAAIESPKPLLRAADSCGVCKSAMIDEKNFMKCGRYGWNIVPTEICDGFEVLK